MPQGSNNEVVEQRTCIDGVNEQVAAASKNQCIDARNVWERGGRVVQRPGSTGFSRIGVFQTDDYMAPLHSPAYPIAETATPEIIYDSSVVFVSEFSPGVFVTQAVSTTPTFTAPTGILTLNGLTVGNRWYIGASRPFSALVIQKYLYAQAGATTATLEYWNGTSWAALSYHEYAQKDNSDWLAPARHLGPSSTTYTKTQFTARTQSDWHPTTVNGVFRYWWRFTIAGAALNIWAGGPAYGGPANLISTPENGYFGGGILRYVAAQMRGTPFIVKANFPTSSRWVGALPYIDSIGSTYFSSETLDNTRWATWQKTWGNAEQLASAAVNVQGLKVYLAYNGHVTVHRALPDAADNIEAHVETADWAIGPGAPYDQSSIALLKAFPAASLITWFQNRLWFGAIDGEPNAIRWSAAAPYNEVIPALAVEYIDQPPTAMKPLGENMVIYTQDNIYLSVQDSVDDFGVPHYKFLKVVAGRGCVAQNSVVEINGRHIFLSEDGLYAFDGTSQIKKITLQSTFTSLGVSLAGSLDRLESTFRSVNTAARGGASAVHWRRERVALFSIPINGSTSNNITVVWDYERDKFWLWDGLQAQFWVSDNGTGYDETVYFGTQDGKIYRLDRGLMDDDGVGISTYLVTSPIGLRDSMHKGLTEIKALAANTVEELTISSWPNGISSQAKSGLLKFDDYNAAKVGTGKVGTMKVSPVNIRFRHTHFKTDGSYFLVKVAGGGTAAKPFDLVNLDIRYTYKYVDTR